MKYFHALIGSIAGIAILIALLGGGYFLITYFGELLATLEAPTRSLIVIGSAVVLLSAVIVSQGLRARPDADRPVQSASIYEHLLAAVSTRPSAAEVAALERSLALTGSSKVIAAYVRLKSSTSEHRQELLKSLLLEMRADLGRAEYIRKDSDLLELIAQDGEVRVTPGRHEHVRS